MLMSRRLGYAFIETYICLKKQPDSPTQKLTNLKTYKIKKL